MLEGALSSARPIQALAVQELVDYCLDFLHDSPPDLTRCALVSRDWTKTSQMHLFSHLIIGSPGYSYGDSAFLAAARHRCRSLCQVLSTTPRLLRFVKSLQIQLDTIPFDALAALPNFSFPSLQRIVASGNWMPAASMIIQELLSLETLSTISISGNFPALSEFISVLSRCSATITDLSFCSVRIPPAGTTIHPMVDDRRIEIQALDLWWSSGIHDWLNSPECLFDFSNLTRLRLNENTSLPQWVAFAPSIPRVEHLQFQPQLNGVDAIDLAPFTNLKCVEVFIEFRNDVTSALETLATLSPSNQIETIRFRLTHTGIPNSDSGAEIDRQLIALPMPYLRAVELVYITSPLPSVVSNFPRLHARKLVRVLRGASAYA
ncbi:hypothetical protein K438DRAFT_1988143 [Mycena galopus ATCC 62051]|nr:hypothetical protein K438DRAFT_1988143 [Mycena galopus ATCC 62051]